MRELGANADIWQAAEGWDVEGCLDLIASLGFRGVLLYSGEGVGFVEQNRERIGDALDARGLSLMQLHADWPSLIDAEGGMRSRAFEEHVRWAELAVELKARTLVVHPTGLAQGGRYLDGEEAMEALATSYGELAEILHGSRVTLAVENDIPWHEGPTRPAVGWRIGDLLTLCRWVGRGRMGICLDASHCWANGEDPAEAAMLAGNAIVTTHIHDTRGDYDEHLPVGEGKTDWKHFIAALADDVPLVLEIRPVALAAEAERVLAVSRSRLLEAMGAVS